MRSWVGAGDDDGRIRYRGRIGWPRRDGGVVVIGSAPMMQWNDKVGVGQAQAEDAPVAHQALRRIANFCAVEAEKRD